MSNNEWVQEGTPRDAEWSAEDDYGVPLEPTEWDDYSAEQAVPVPPPAPTDETPAEGADVTTAPDPDDVVAGSEEPIVADEPTLGDEQFREAEGFQHDGDQHHDAAFEEQPADVEPADVGRDDVAADGWQDAEHEPLAQDADILTTDPAVQDAGQDELVETREVDLDDDATRVHPRDDFGFGRPVEGTDAGLDDRPVDDGDAFADDQVVDDPEAAALRDPNFDADGDPEATALHNPNFDVDGDPEATALVTPVAPTPTGDGGAGLGAGVAAGTGAAAMAGLYRNDHDAQHTQVIDTSERLAAEQAEEERLAQQLRDDKVARDQRLGLVATSDANAVREAPVRPRPGVGRFASFGLFILRLVTGGILGVLAYQILGNIDRTSAFIGQTLIPEPRLVSWILGFTLAVMALFLIIGLAVRVVGLLLAVIAGCALAFVRWGQFSPFVDGLEGFIGDKDLLMAAVGIALFTLGGGRAGIDGAFSAARYNSRISKAN